MLGEKVGQYQIMGKLGEGGMGAVYLAQHVLIGRPAAIKVLKSEYSHRPELVERFFNEARAASAIRHPGIIEIYDFGYHVDDSAYLVMEHLDGESLENRLRRLSRLPVESALSLIRQVASGLAAAHDKAIIHRDLKPDNIFVVPDPDIPGGERTKILDFGIAKLAAQGGPGSYKTSTGTVMGTPAYMAPEQCKGAGRVDRRADLYALGCILFEMLCGRPPFVAEGGGEVMAQHIYASPPSPLAFDPTIPAEVDALIGRLLAKEADQRLQSAREVIAAIDSIAERTSRLEVGGAAVQDTSAPASAVTGVAAAVPSPKTTLGAAAGSLPPVAGRRARAAYLAPALAALVLAGGVGIFALTRGGDGGRAGSAGKDEPGLAGEAGAEDAALAATDHAEAAGIQADGGTTARGDLGTSEPGADTGPATPLGSEIELVIDSSPRGADVYKQPLGLRVGPTPYRVKQTAAEGELVYVLKKPGYRTKEIVLQADRSTKIRVELERRTSGTTTAGDTTAAGSGTDRKPVATDSGADKKPVADDDGAGKKPVTSDDGAGKKPVASDDGAGKKPVVSGEGPGKDQETTTDSARESSVTGRSLNPFEKKPKKPKQGKGRSLNPFEK